MPHFETLGIPSDLRVKLLNELSDRLAKQSRLRPGVNLEEQFNLFGMFKPGVGFIGKSDQSELLCFLTEMLE